MKIYQRYTDLIGNTPLLRLNNYEKQIGSEAMIVAKLESHNPLSSVKDRLAFALINAMEEQGLVKPDTVFVEPTSGNTGVGLAFICAAKGYKLILTMPASVSKERTQIVKALGAEVILTDAPLGMKGAIAEANRLLSLHHNYMMPMQFENLANPEIHRRTTAIEILNDTDGKVDIFVAGVGTGGTLTGVGEVLKKHNEHIKVIAVEPKSSAVLSGNAPAPHKIQGIGAGFVPKVLNTNIYDEVIQIEDTEAFDYARLLAKTEGVFAGISSGATLAAATKLALRPENKGKMIVFIVADTGERYLTTPLWELGINDVYLEE
jgi:cysteine synthase A